MTTPVPVCLMTDFGTQDPYVGIMKSVIQDRVPYPPVIDLTHEVPPQDERTAAFLLEYALPDCPSEAVVVLVVDPGVGTDRDIIAVETTEGRRVVAPDTGMVDGLDWKRARLVKNEDVARETISSTFHGRDWFAPVGRYLSLGKSFEDLGPAVSRPSTGGLIPDPVETDDGIAGEIVHVDRFGNLVTNVEAEQLRAMLKMADGEGSCLRIDVNGHTVDGLASTYGETETLSGIVGSFEHLEIAMPDGSARETLGADRGMPVKLYVAGS